MPNHTSKRAIDLPISKELIADFAKSTDTVSEAFKKFAEVFVEGLPPDLLDELEADVAYEEACAEHERAKKIGEENYKRWKQEFILKQRYSFGSGVNLLPPLDGLA